MKYPKHSYSTARDFKIDRRIAIRKALQAIKEARFASFYLPGTAYKDLQRAHELLNGVTASVSVKEWGR